MMGAPFMTGFIGHERERVTSAASGSLMVSPLRYEAFVPGEEHPAHAQKTEARMNAAPMMSSTL